MTEVFRFAPAPDVCYRVEAGPEPAHETRGELFYPFTAYFAATGAVAPAPFSEQSA